VKLLPLLTAHRPTAHLAARHIQLATQAASPIQPVTLLVIRAASLIQPVTLPVTRAASLIQPVTLLATRAANLTPPEDPPVPHPARHTLTVTRAVLAHHIRQDTQLVIRPDTRPDTPLDILPASHTPLGTPQASHIRPATLPALRPPHPARMATLGDTRSHLPATDGLIDGFIT